MSESKPVVYDPDPTDLQIRALEQISIADLQATDLSSPVIVQLLVHNQRVNLTQLKAAQGEATNLHAENAKLRDERENLRIEVAELRSQVNPSWIEIPISILSGFAINILASNPQSGLGWFLLIVSVVILLILRGSQIQKLFNRRNTTKEH